MWTLISKCCMIQVNSWDSLRCKYQLRQITKSGGKNVATNKSCILRKMILTFQNLNFNIFWKMSFLNKQAYSYVRQSDVAPFCENYWNPFLVVKHFWCPFFQKECFFRPILDNLDQFSRLGPGSSNHAKKWTKNSCTWNIFWKQNQRIVSWSL